MTLESSLKSTVKSSVKNSLKSLLQNKFELQTFFSSFTMSIHFAPSMGLSMCYCM